MKLKNLLLTTAACAMFIMGIAATASAVAITVQTQQWYEWGRLYDVNTNGDFEATNTNPYDGSSTQDLTPGVYAGTDGTEDSFGIAAVSGIFETGTTNYFYDRASASKDLTMFYSNGDDVMINPLTANVSQIFSDGFVARFYLDSDWDYNPGNNFAGRGSDNDGNTGADYYLGATEGTMVLELTGHTRYLDYGAGDNQSFQLASMGNLTTGQAGGVIFLDVTDGLWAPKFDTDFWDMTKVNGYGTADFRLTTTMWPNIGASEWNLEGTGTAQGDVPEPSTIALFWIGLLGLAGVRRRGKK